jgi:hypothetical protein
MFWVPTFSHNIKQREAVSSVGSSNTASPRMLGVQSLIISNLFRHDVSGLRTKRNGFMDSVFINKFKVYCIAETWLNDGFLSHSLFLDSFYVFRADRDYLSSNIKRGGGGRVLVAVSI